MNVKELCDKLVKVMNRHAYRMRLNHARIEGVMPRWTRWERQDDIYIDVEFIGGVNGEIMSIACLYSPAEPHPRFESSGNFRATIEAFTDVVKIVRHCQPELEAVNMAAFFEMKPWMRNLTLNC